MLFWAMCFTGAPHPTDSSETLGSSLWLCLSFLIGNMKASDQTVPKGPASSGMLTFSTRTKQKEIVSKHNTSPVSVRAWPSVKGSDCSWTWNFWAHSLPAFRGFLFGDRELGQLTLVPTILELCLVVDRRLLGLSPSPQPPLFGRGSLTRSWWFSHV